MQCAEGFILRLSCLLLLLFPSSHVGAATDKDWPWEPFAASADELSSYAGELNDDPDPGVVILFKDVSYSFDSDGSKTYRQHQVYLLTAAKGVDSWSTVGVTWAPWHQETPQIRARVITPDGASHDLDTATLSDSPVGSSKDIFEDRLQREGPLPAVRVGAIVEEEVVVRDKTPLFAAGITSRSFLVDRVPIRHGRLRLEAPTHVPLRFGVRASTVEPERNVVKDHVFLSFDYYDAAPAGPVEAGLPAHLPRYPSVAFATGDSWQAVASQYSELVDQRIAESPNLEQWIDVDLSASRNDLERIERLLATVNDTVRYTGLELGAASIIPVSPRQTLQRRYGDCKDQATLLVALLRSHGIPAHVALLDASFGADVEPNLPGLGDFNHAIVYVPMARPIWIDPTDPFTRLGELPAADQGRWALVASASSERLIRTPTADSANNRIVERRELRMADHGSGQVVETTEYHGVWESRQRAWAASYQGSLTNAFTDYAGTEFLSEQVLEAKVTEATDFSTPFTLELTFGEAGRVATDLDEAVVAIFPAALANDVPDELQSRSETEREADFAYPVPCVREQHYRIVPPTGMVPRNLPEDVTLELGAARFEQKFRWQDGIVEGHLRFDSGPRRLTPEQFEATRLAILDFAEREVLTLYFDPEGSLKLAAGDSRQAISDFRRWITEDSQPVHRTRLVQTLLAVGMGEEARRQAKLGAEQHPDSTMAHWALGLALSHDTLGRVHQRGMDRDGAVAALQRARELDSEDSLARAELAILLDFGSDGERYGDPVQLDLAIAEYRAWRQDFDSPNLDTNLMNSLFWAERWQELEEFSAELPSSDIRNIWRMVALAARHGSNRVFQEARSLGLGQEKTVEILAGSAQWLALGRRYEVAAEILRQLASSSPNPAAAMAAANLYSRLQRLDEVPASNQQEPANLLRQLLLGLASPGDLAVFHDLFHPDYAPETELLEVLQRAFHRSLEQQSQNLRVSRAAARDFVAASFEIHTTGTAATGYRLKADSLVPGKNAVMTVFAVATELAATTELAAATDASLRIVALEGDYAPMAKETLKFLDAGNLDGAHQWLDWARQDLKVEDSDDAFAGNPFPLVWQRNQEADEPLARLAANLLLAASDDGATAVPYLEAQLATAPESQQRALEIALLRALPQAESWPALEAHATNLLTAVPESQSAFEGLAVAMVNQDKLDELSALAEQRLSLLEDDATALTQLSNNAIRQGRTDDAIAYFQRLQAASEDDSTTYNSWAWMLVFSQPVPEQALVLAQKAAELGNYREYPSLHTLATVYAELERPLEAYRVLMQALQLKPEPEPGSPDWYVLGRIAESYGLEETAGRYYQKVDQGQQGAGPLTSHTLAQRRLASLAKSAKHR